MSEYVYTNPLDDGYKQFKLTKKQHNSLFKYRQIKWHDKYEYYYDEHHIILHRFINIYGIALYSLLFPAMVLLEGFANIKGVLKEYKEMYNQKKYGSFIGNNIWNDSEMYKKVMDIIN